MRHRRDRKPLRAADLALELARHRVLHRRELAAERHDEVAVFLEVQEAPARDSRHRAEQRAVEVAADSDRRQRRGARRRARHLEELTDVGDPAEREAVGDEDHVAVPQLAGEREAHLRRVEERRAAPRRQPREHDRRRRLARRVHGARRESNVHLLAEDDDRELVLRGEQVHQHSRRGARLREVVARHRRRAIEREHEAHSRLTRSDLGPQPQRKPRAPVTDPESVNLGDNLGIEQRHMNRDAEAQRRLTTMLGEMHAPTLIFQGETTAHPRRQARSSVARERVFRLSSAQEL